jgi:hypothetical protein
MNTQFLKSDSFEIAKTKSITIIKNEFIIGRLLPVGKWILSHNDIISEMTSWRNNSKKYFLTVFENTFEKTYNYLNNFCILPNSRILFLIYDDSNKLIGNLGFVVINKNTVELDNLIRGVKGGDAKLIENAEVCLLNFIFSNNLIKNVLARVLSFNVKVLQIHKKIGFKIINEDFLLKKKNSNLSVHEKCQQKETNVTYGLINLKLSKKNFYKNNITKLI